MDLHHLKSVVDLVEVNPREVVRHQEAAEVEHHGSEARRKDRLRVKAREVLVTNRLNQEYQKNLFQTERNGKRH